MKRIGGRSSMPSSISKPNAIKMANAWRSLGLNARVIPNSKGYNVYIGNPKIYNARKGYRDNRGIEAKVKVFPKFKKYDNFNFTNKPIKYSNYSSSETVEYLRKIGREDLIGREAFIQDLGLFGGVMGINKEPKVGFFDFFDVRQLEENSIVIVPPKISKIKDADGMIEYRIERLGIATNASDELLDVMQAPRIGISGERADREYQKKQELPSDEEVNEAVRELQWSFDDQIVDEMSWNASFGEGSEASLALWGNDADDDADELELWEDIEEEIWESRAFYMEEAGFIGVEDGIRAIKDKSLGMPTADPKSYQSATEIFENNMPNLQTGKWKRKMNYNRYGSGLGTDIGMKDLRRIIRKWVDISVNMSQETPSRKDAFDRKIAEIPELSNFVDLSNEKGFSPRIGGGEYIYNPRYDRWIVGFLTEFNVFTGKNRNLEDAEKFLEALIVAKNDPYAKDLPSIDIDALAVKTLKDLGMAELDWSNIVAYRDEQDPASRLNPTFWRSVGSRRANL
tara:strand:+ start:408 stop:1943 length:1536 start_codon:yes stop_codon:yes gene_type:complete